MPDHPSCVTCYYHYFNESPVDPWSHGCSHPERTSNYALDVRSSEKECTLDGRWHVRATRDVPRWFRPFAQWWYTRKTIKNARLKRLGLT